MKRVKSTWLVRSLRATVCTAMAVGSGALIQSAVCAELPPATSQPAGDHDLTLGMRFESQSAGISFCPVRTLRLVDRVNERWVAEWSDEKFTWRLTLGRQLQPEPIPLVGGPDNFGKVGPGLLETTVDRLKATIPGCTVLRQDVTNIAEGGANNPHKPNVRRPNVGLIAIRYTNGGHHYLSQQALIQATERLYYLLTLTTPGSNAGENAEDPGERAAVEAFTAMLDSVRLTDRGAVRQDQEDRLDHTRALLVNLTGQRLRNSLIKEQWMRIIKDGKDIGYSYITEETAAGIPRKLTAAEVREGKSIHDVVKPGDGVLVGIRGRMIVEGVRADKKRGDIQTDSQTWFYTTGDTKHEDWSRIIISDDHISPNKNYVDEVGISDKRQKPKLILPPEPDGLLPAGPKRPEPEMTMKDDYQLEVTLRTNHEAPEPIRRQLSPWYIPQAVDHLLPRLLPRKVMQPKHYLFACYVSETREVMHRYVDVLPEQRVNFNNEVLQATQIRDRLGIDGSVTIHYISPEGVYLGSENKDTKIVVVPTDAATLTGIWKNADLRHNNGQDHPAAQQSGRARETTDAKP